MLTTILSRIYTIHRSQGLSLHQPATRHRGMQAARRRGQAPIRMVPNCHPNPPGFLERGTNFTPRHRIQRVDLQRFRERFPRRLLGRSARALLILFQHIISHGTPPGGGRVYRKGAKLSSPGRS